MSVHRRVVDLADREGQGADGDADHVLVVIEESECLGEKGKLRDLSCWRRQRHAHVGWSSGANEN